jgi:hypothetical protein
MSASSSFDRDINQSLTGQHGFQIHVEELKRDSSSREASSRRSSRLKQDESLPYDKLEEDLGNPQEVSRDAPKVRGQDVIGAELKQEKPPKQPAVIKRSKPKEESSRYAPQLQDDLGVPQEVSRDAPKVRGQDVISPELKQEKPRKKPAVIKLNKPNEEPSRYPQDDLGTPQQVSGASSNVLDQALISSEPSLDTQEFFADVLETRLVVPDLPEEHKVEEHKPETFVTEARQEDKAVEQPFLVNDLLFPGGKVAKLVRITQVRISNYKNRNVKLGDIVSRLKLNDSYPVILLSGAEGDLRGRLLVGLVRAAYSTDAVIFSTGLKSGIEQTAYKRRVNYIGVCPEDLIVYPTKASRGDRLGELAGGHSHFIVLGTKGDSTRWDAVTQFKIDLITRLQKGRGGPGAYKCRGVCVVAGDNTNCLKEIETVLKAGWPVLALEGSPLGSQIAAIRSGSGGQSLPSSFVEAVRKGKVFMFPESGTAEHLASAVHLHLAVTF